MPHLASRPGIERAVGEDRSSWACDVKEAVEGKADDWARTVVELSERGVRLEDVLLFYRGLLGEPGFFNPESSTTADVVFQAVVPLTAAKQCSFATAVNGGRPLKAQRFVTHTWGSAFRNTVAAVVADALGEPTFGDLAQKLGSKGGTEELLEAVRTAGWAEMSYWVCCLSVNQHRSVCGFKGMDSVSRQPYPICTCGLAKCTEGDLSEMNKFAEMMAHLHTTNGLTHVIAVDADFCLFTRAWCVAELVEAHHQGMPQELKIQSPKSVDQHLKQLQKLSVRHCQASNPRDLQEIMGKIEDIETFDNHLQELLLNRSSGLLPTWQRAINGYFLSWSEFSPEYNSMLEAGENHDRGGRALVLALATAVWPVSLFAFAPLPRPGEASSEAFWATFAYFPPMVIMVLIGMQVLFYSLARLRADNLKMPVAVLFPILTTFVQVTVLWGWHRLLDAWPVPWASVLCTPSVLVMMSMLWWSIREELRQECAVRFRCAIVAVGMVVVMWVSMGPLLISLMSLSDSLWLHSLLAFLLLLQKLLCERAALLFTKALSADVLPIFIFCCSTGFESLLCTALCRGGNWFLFAELIGFDLVENCFHLWSITRRKEPKDAESASQVILAQLLLREYVELTAPAKFLCMIVALYYGGQRHRHDLVCQWSHEEFVTACWMVVLDFFVELLISLSTWLLLHRMGRKPWRILMGVLRQHFWCFLSWDIFIMTQRLSEQSRFGGSDYTFQFKWLLDQDASWDCGLQWL